MDRVRVWLAVSPVIAAGVLVAHTVAYRATGTATGPAHGYLAHAPQVLVVAALAGLALAAFAARRRTPALWTFPAAAIATFVVQEHLEALAHAGTLPFLLDSPAFLLGLLLQAPVALGAWLLARALLGGLVSSTERRPRLPRALRELASPRLPHVRAFAVLPLPARGPPALLRR